MITINIPGKPIAQSRPRFARRGKFVSTYNPQETEAGRFLLLVKSHLPKDWEPVIGPVHLVCHFRLPIPKSTPKKAKALMIDREIHHISKPDVSNLVKFVEDACNGLLWQDDSQIISIDAKKTYAEDAGTTIGVYQVASYLCSKMG